MERILQGIPGVVPYFDDVFISGESESQLLDRLKRVLHIFSDKGLKLKKDKCQIGVPSVEFLGFCIDASGIRPTEKKVKAIKEAPIPKNKGELQAFLGLLNFYAVFLQQKATVAEPLHRLLANSTAWAWGKEEEDAFTAVKGLISSDSVLIQYSEVLPLVLTCDASPFGVGAILSHKLPDGTEAPIAFYSKTMSPAERNYSQLDKEALAAVAGVKRFHEYLYGRTFELVTDHKPLLGLLAGDKQTPNYMSPRLTRWSIFLSAYSYRLIHRPGRTIGHADALSRCPTKELIEDPAPAAEILLLDIEQSSPITSTEVAEHTKDDKVLSKVLSWVLRGWPQTVDGEEFRTFKNKQTELSVSKGCLLWGERVIIPSKLRKTVMETLHTGHPGIVKMKALARSYLWWPGLDQDITNWVATCTPCQESRPAPPKTTPLEWERPASPWARIHIDFAGPMEGQNFLIVVDAYSKWLEVIRMSSTTTEATIKALRKLFATHGLPDALVSDNGPQLTSKSMQSFLAELGIRQILVSPHFPASNGQAEIMVRLTKDTLTRMGPGDWQDRIDQFLLMQHVTPSTTTNKSPAELLMGRKLRTTLDRLNPTYNSDSHTDIGRVERQLEKGSLVFAKNFSGDPKWLPGCIEEITGPKSYRVQLEDGRLWRRHIDQLRDRVKECSLRGGNTELQRNDLPNSRGTQGENKSTPTPGAWFQILHNPDMGRPQDRAIPSDSQPREGLRRTGRITKPPVHFQDYVDLRDYVNTVDV